MSKTRVFRLPGSSIFVRQNNVEDLLGPKGNPLFKKLGPKKDREARQAAKELFCTMMEMVAEDMVEENAVFVFPRQKFGFMRIGDIARDGDKTVLDVRHDFLYFGGRITLDPIIQRCNGNRIYRYKLIRPRDNRLRELIETGHSYAE